MIPTRDFPKNPARQRLDVDRLNGAARTGKPPPSGTEAAGGILLLTDEVGSAGPYARRPPKGHGGDDGVLLLTEEVFPDLHEPSPPAADPAKNVPLFTEEPADAGGPALAGDADPNDDLLVLTDEIADDPMTPWWQTPEFEQFIRDHGTGEDGEAVEADRIALARATHRAASMRNSTRDPHAGEPAAPPPVPQSDETDIPFGNGDMIMESEHSAATAAPHPAGNGAGIEGVQAAAQANADPVPPESTTQATNKPAGLGQAAGVLGAVAWLMARSAEHRHLFLADLEWRVLSAIALGQCRLVQKDGQPVAFVSWANVSEEVAQRLKSGERRLKPEEWKSGDRRLMVDVVAPFGGAEPLVKEVREKVFAES